MLCVFVAHFSFIGLQLCQKRLDFLYQSRDAEQTINMFVLINNQPRVCTIYNSCTWLAMGASCEVCS